MTTRILVTGPQLGVRAMRAIMDTTLIRERSVEIETGETAGFGFIAVGVVCKGLPHEVGLRFEAKGADAEEARRNLEGEIEAYFS